MFYAVRNVAIGAATLALAVGFSLPAKAAYTVTFSQVGADVDASGGGTIDLNGLARGGGGLLMPEVFATFAVAVTGATGDTSEYFLVNGPLSFGTGLFSTNATMGTGDLVGVSNLIGQPDGAVILVPMGYASGAPLSDTATYAGQTFATLGFTPGVYVYTFGSGADADTFTVRVAAAPEPGSLPLLVMGLAGLGMVVRRRRA